MARTFTRAALSHGDFYRLCEWLKAADLAGVFTNIELARRAKAELQFDVSFTSAKAALEATGRTLPERGAGDYSTAKRGDRADVIARELVTLMNALGHEPSVALMNLASGRGINAG